MKPEGRGRGRGGHYSIFLCKAGGRGEYYCLGARWADGEGGGGEIIMIDFLRGGRRALSYLPRRSSSQRGGVGGWGGRIIFFLQGRGGEHHFLGAKPLKGSRWVGGDREGRESSQGQVGGRGGGDYYYLFIFCGVGRVIIISAS